MLNISVYMSADHTHTHTHVLYMKDVNSVSINF